MTRCRTIREADVTLRKCSPLVAALLLCLVASGCGGTDSSEPIEPAPGDVSVTVQDIVSVNVDPPSDSLIDRIESTVIPRRRTELHGWIEAELGPGAGSSSAWITSLIAASPLSANADPPIWVVANNGSAVAPLNRVAEQISTDKIADVLRDQVDRFREEEEYDGIYRLVAEAGRES